MPELPEVEAVCRQLAPLVIGSKVVNLDLKLPRIIREGNVDHLLGVTFLSVERFGKFIQMRTTTHISLFVHLRMTGQLLWEPAVNLKDRYVRCIITTDRGELYFRDVRTLGGFWVCDSDRPPWKNLGMDPLIREFSVGYLSQRFSTRKVPIKCLLLDQTIVAGIGNIYASEILFSARINPQRLAESLSPPEIIRLHGAIVEILQKAIESKGTTFKDFRLSDGKEGEFNESLKVYAHQDDACTVCKSSILRIVQSGRSSYYCPQCQPHVIPKAS